MTPEPLLLKAVGYTLKLLKIREDANEKEKQMKVSALEAFRDAIVVTRSYIADRREGNNDRDRDKELELSRAWNTLGLRVKNIDTDEAKELYVVCFKKADYWSDPTLWQENKEGEIDISLNKVDREISQLLQ